MITSIDTSRIHRLDPKLLLIVGILQPIFSILTNYLFTIDFYNPISVWSHRLINATLQANLTLLIIWCFIIFKVGKHNLSSIWLTKQKLVRGIIIGITFWFIIQIVVFIYVFLSENPVSFNPNMNKEIGLILGQLFGNALNEEFLFRGIFFLQFYLLARKRYSKQMALMIAIAGSQLFFAVSHLPNRILVKHYENLVVDQIKLLIMGTLFVIFYIRTENFALTVIMHSLLNYPLRLFESSSSYTLVVLTIFLLSIIFWNKIKILIGE